MAFFKNFTKKDDAAETDESGIESSFESIIVDTQNVIQELKSVSSFQKIPLANLDFKIISHKTHFKAYKEDDWGEVSIDDLKKFESKKFLLNPELELAQEYKVEIYKKSSSDKPLLDIVLGGNKNLTKVVATVKKSFDVEYSPKLSEYIIHEINKKKIKNGIFISILDQRMHEEVSKVVSKIRVNNILEEDQSLVVCEGISPVLSINDDLIFHYKKKVKKEDNFGRIDHSKRGFLLAVEKGETVIEYIKAKRGVPGRNCKGEYLSVAKPKTTHEIDFTVTDAITVKEDDDRILYIANRNGYVNKTSSNKYDIQDRMEVKEVSFKSTGSIETGTNTDIKINVKQKDIFKDAIGTGMHVETTEIKVEGNVGSSAIIDAVDTTIGGQTHQNSKVFSKKAKIKVHRGYAEGKEITIDRLEGGKVVADTVKVSQVIGGQITAKKIYIDKLLSNATLTASDLIDVNELLGSNNKFIIDPKKIKGYHEKIENLNNKISELENELRKIPSLLEIKKSSLEKNRSVIDLVKSKIMELKKLGKKPPASLLLKLKTFQTHINEYNELLKTYKNKKQEINEYKNELEEMQSGIFKAKVINRTPWKDFNEVKFKLITPPVEVTYMPHENEITRVITVKEVFEDEFKIVRTGEFEE